MARYESTLEDIIKSLRDYDIEDNKIEQLLQIYRMLFSKGISSRPLKRAIDILSDNHLEDYDLDEAKEYLNATIEELSRIVVAQRSKISRR